MLFRTFLAVFLSTLAVFSSAQEQAQPQSDSDRALLSNAAAAPFTCLDRTERCEEHTDCCSGVCRSLPGTNFPNRKYCFKVISKTSPGSTGNSTPTTKPSGVSGSGGSSIGGGFTAVSGTGTKVSTPTTSASSISSTAKPLTVAASDEEECLEKDEKCSKNTDCCSGICGGLLEDGSKFCFNTVSGTGNNRSLRGVTSTTVGSKE